MSNKEFLTNWNNIMDYKVTESDLLRPTEVFLYNSLKSYLKKFEIDVSRVLEVDVEDVSLLRIKFCKYIEHLYKISDELNTFLYIDLILPLPKKTCHLLETLLNFLLYYNMVKIDVIETTNDLIKKFETIFHEKNQIQIENENMKVKAEVIKKQHNENKLLLPKLIDEQIELRENNEKCETEINKLQYEVKSLDKRILDVHFKLANLQSEIVTADEANYLVDSIKLVDEKLVELNDIEEFAIKNNQETYNDIKLLDENMKQLELTMEKYPIPDLIESELQRKQLLAHKNELQLTNTNTIKMKESIEELSLIVENLKLIKNEKYEILNALQEDENIIKIESEITKLMIANEDFNYELGIVMDEHEEQQLLQNFIIDSGKVIITNILKT